MIADAIDLATVQIHNSPRDLAEWTPTVAITQLTMHPGAGLSFLADVPLTWDYHIPGWGNPTAGDDGNILYTVWALVQINGRWHGSGFIQMWKGRPSTGAPILTEWRNWAYARDRWGEMVDYVPKVGDEIGFVLSAGNARKERAVTSRRERSNVIAVRLPANDAGVFRFGEHAVAPPASSPASPPASPPAPEVPASLSSRDVEQILIKQEMDTKRILDAIQQARATLDAFAPLLQRLVDKTS